MLSFHTDFTLTPIIHIITYYIYGTPYWLLCCIYRLQHSTSIFKYNIVGVILTDTYLIHHK